MISCTEKFKALGLQILSLHAMTIKTTKYMKIIAIRKGIIPITATVTSNSVLYSGTVYRFFAGLIMDELIYFGTDFIGLCKILGSVCLTL